MPIRTTYLVLLGAFALTGCPTPEVLCPGGGRPPCLVLDDTGPVDGGGTATDGAVDAPRGDTGPVGGCGTVGAAGGHCRGAMAGIGGMCASGLRCQNEIRPMMSAIPYSIRTAFGIEQGTNFDAATGFYEEVPMAMAVPANDIPVPMATGSLCTQDCDAGAMTDACGTCATCSTDIGTAGVLATYLLYPVADRVFGTDMGWCRSDCMFDAATAGATCPGTTGATGTDAHTCAPGSNVCVEGCISDNECRFSFEQTRSGLFVSNIDNTIPSSCNATTHRCSWTHPSSNSVGDPCTHNSDCTADVGLCLNGGTCGEYQSGSAADTDPATFVCDGGRGISLGNGGNGGTICVAGCVMPSDCLPGNTCIPLGAGMMAGTFTGYCLGICDTAPTDPDGTGPMTAADDVLYQCQTGEQCDNADPTATNLDPTGDCRVPCAMDSDCTARTPDEGNYCEIVAGSSPAFGFCRWLDQVCSYQDLTADCFGTQVCDLLAFPENLGLCVAPCAVDADCTTAGDVCVTTGGRNVCRQPCTTGGAACPMGEICQGVAPNQFCEQMTTM